MSFYKSVVACFGVLLVSGACVPSTAEVERTFGENSPMAAIQAEGTLVVAVPPDSPPFAFSEGAGEPTGFLVDLATHLAADLDVEIEYVEAPSEEMASLVAGDERREIGDEDAHLAFPLTTITNQTYKIRSGSLGFDVTTPFFVAHQRLLVPTDSDIEGVEDLAGTKVCSLVDPEVGIPVEELAPAAEVFEVSTTTECAVALRKGTVDAATADEVVLLGILSDLDERDEASNYEIVGEQTTTQGFSPYVVRGMAAFASDVFNDVKDDGRWAEAYEKWITPLTGDEAIAADLTLEEAAAIYPDVTPPPGSEDE